MPAESHDGWVESARRGDRKAFGALYERYAKMVHGILMARVPAGEADDLVQDVFMVALRRMHTLRDSSAFGSWLATLARHRAIDYHRRVRRSEELPAELPGTESERAEITDVLAAIRGLPDTYSETLVLRLVEGLSGPEIAARTGLTPASVRVNLCRGMKILREKLGLPQGQQELEERT